MAFTGCSSSCISPSFPSPSMARSSLPASPQQRDPRIPKVTRCACPSFPLQGHRPQRLRRQRGPAGAALPPTALLPPRRAPKAAKQPGELMSNWGAVVLSGEPPQPSLAALSTRREGCSHVCTPDRYTGGPVVPYPLAQTRGARCCHIGSWLHPILKAQTQRGLSFCRQRAGDRSGMEKKPFHQRRFPAGAPSRAVGMGAALPPPGLAPVGGWPASQRASGSLPRSWALHTCAATCGACTAAPASMPPGGCCRKGRSQRSPP